MKKFITIFAFILLVSTLVFAESEITNGRFFVTGYVNGETPQNATLGGNNFSATSAIGGQYSPWYDICIADPIRCSFGRSISVPKYPTFSIGGCIGDCTQFIGGNFTINGTTYQNAFYRGYFTFDQVGLFIPRMMRRKETVTFRKPFTIRGRLTVCQINDFNAPCPADKILFNDDIKGHGALTATFEIKSYQSPNYPIPYLFQKSFDYQFEP